MWNFYYLCPTNSLKMKSNAKIQISLMNDFFSLIHLPSMYSSISYVVQNHSLHYGTSEYFLFVMLIDLIFQSYLMNWFSWKILLIFLNPIITTYPSWILLTRLRSSTLRVPGSAIISWLDTNIHFDGSVNLSVSTTLFRTHCLTIS